MSNRNRCIKIRKRLVCHRCCAKQGAPKIYLTYKDGYGWVCPKCKDLIKRSFSCSQDNDTISRQAATQTVLDFIVEYLGGAFDEDFQRKLIERMNALPSAEPEPLTDKEQRIFLAAMGREEKVCEEVDRNFVREPYEDSLMSVCREIKRKVKGALWT